MADQDEVATAVVWGGADLMKGRPHARASMSEYDVRTKHSTKGNHVKIRGQVLPREPRSARFGVQDACASPERSHLRSSTYGRAVAAMSLTR